MDSLDRQQVCNILHVCSASTNALLVSRQHIHTAAQMFCWKHCWKAGAAPSLLQAAHIHGCFQWLVMPMPVWQRNNLNHGAWCGDKYVVMIDLARLLWQYRAWFYHHKQAVKWWSTSHLVNTATAHNNKMYPIYCTTFREGINAEWQHIYTI
jgi:hypothetical protein